MQHDDLNKKIIDALETKAQQHTKKHVVMDNVFQRLEQKTHQKFNRWGLAGFALAAAITGFTIVPNTVLTEGAQPQDMKVSTPKLTPQLADDLEMLLVLGEDTTHGS